MRVELLGYTTLPDNSHSCNLHDCCGRQVVPGHMLLGSRLEVVCQTPGDPDPDVWIETIIKAVLFLDGAE